MKALVFTMISLCLFACEKTSNINTQSESLNLHYQLKELERLRALEEEIKVERMINISTERHQQRRLIHLVYFDLKEEADKEAVIQEIRKLEDIQVVKQLEVGSFKDLGDKRAMSTMELVMQMAFDTEEDYKSYQKHEIHLALKKALGVHLTGPPITYDYLVE